jgi:CRP-like cAMP-binding protein
MVHGNINRGLDPPDIENRVLVVRQGSSWGGVGMSRTSEPIAGKTTQLIIDSLMRIPIFDKLDSDELRIASAYMKPVDIKPGEIVFKEGDRGDFVCFVVEGTLDVIKRKATGEDVVISNLTKGRSIGEMAVIDNFPRSATVKGKTEATLLTLSQDKFNAILNDHAGIGVEILKGISRLLSLNLRQTSGRLADLLLSPR